MSSKVRFALAAGAIAAILLAAIIWLGIRASAQNRRIASLESELAMAKARASQVPKAVVQPAPVTLAPPPVVAVKPPEKPASSPAISAEVEELGARLSEATASVARAQARVNELETQVLNLSADRARLATAESQTRDQLEDLDRKLEAATNEKPAREKRISDLEAEVARLRAQGSESDHKGALVAEMTRELQELSRRQQLHLTSIMRRYREVTDLLRSLPGSDDPARGGAGGGPEMARIQTAIAMADEDLRQLNDLNARLGRVQKQIASAGH